MKREIIRWRSDFDIKTVIPILDNLREYDRLETEAYGFGDINHRDLIAYALKVAVKKQVGFYKNKPIFVCGLAKVSDSVLEVWFLASNEIRKGHFLDITEKASNILGEYSSFDIKVLVWNKHKVSHAWLKKLGFHKTSERVMPETGETFYDYLKPHV